MWASPEDALPLKFASPLYVATSDFRPAASEAKVHWVATERSMGPQPLPPLMVTVPVGAPAPGDTGDTDQETV